MARGSKALSMVIPGLFGPENVRQLPEAWQGLSLPVLETLLSRARGNHAVGRGLESTLFGLFQIAAVSGRDFPVAAVTRQWEVRDAGGYWWLRADPVHLRADRDRIVMLGNGILDISHEECHVLAEELNRHFAGEDWMLDAANARRWYLRLDKDPRITTAALPDVVGRDVLRYLPGGPASQHWRSVMNEAQMVLHSSRINREREAHGAPIINSLWFWGSGRLPCPVSEGWSRLWGNDALSLGLAALMNIPGSSVPSDAAEWLDCDIPGEHLLVLDGLRERIQFADVEGWRDFLQSLHDAWLEPLFDALKQGGLAALNLYPADGSQFSVTAGGARRWWIRRRRLEQWL